MASKKTSTLLFAMFIPGIEDPNDIDPEQMADELVLMINEERKRNGGYAGDVLVSGIPAAQWMTAKTMHYLAGAIANHRDALAKIAEYEHALQHVADAHPIGEVCLQCQVLANSALRGENRADFLEQVDDVAQVE